MTKINNIHFSSESDEWESPKNVFHFYNKLFNFSLDAAATIENSLCSNYFTKENNSLEQDWNKYGNIWCNPPYGKLIGKFIEKGYEESKKGCSIVFLIPARTDTKYWHNFCSKGEVFFIKGRLSFKNKTNLLKNISAPFPSAIVIFRNRIPSTNYIDKKIYECGEITAYFS